MATLPDAGITQRVHCQGCLMRAPASSRRALSRKAFSAARLRARDISLLRVRAGDRVNPANHAFSPSCNSAGLKVTPHPPIPQSCWDSSPDTQRVKHNAIAVR
jgi:hypothetical protein